MVATFVRSAGLGSADAFCDCGSVPLGRLALRRGRKLLRIASSASTKTLATIPVAGESEESTPAFVLACPLSIAVLSNPVTRSTRCAIATRSLCHCNAGPTCWEKVRSNHCVHQWSIEQETHRVAFEPDRASRWSPPAVCCSPMRLLIQSDV